MMIVFCEYVVEDHSRDEFLAWVRSRPDRWEGVELAENAEQPGVFVELRRAPDARQAQRIAQERREGRSWEKMNGWVKGKEKGLRIWTFRPVI